MKRHMRWWLLSRLAWSSAWYRRHSLGLSVVAIAISLALLLAVDMIRLTSKQTFLNTVSQTDLIVGARSGAENLLLYSVFHLGDATNNLDYDSYVAIANLPQVDWTIPISLGDSHRGYRVIGTSQDFFQHYRYAGGKSLSFQKGRAFSQVYDVVLGSEVARQLGYDLDASVVLTHGMMMTHYSQHDDKPFKTVGILNPTGTPMDRALMVSLPAIEAIHVDWRAGVRMPLHLSAQQALRLSLTPKTITAFMVGLKNRSHTFQVQRQINRWSAEPLTAILPGATLAKLWQSLVVFERVLLMLSVLVLVSAFLGLLTTLLATINERRREMALLRAVGAHRQDLMLLISFEALSLVKLAAVLALGLMLAVLGMLSAFDSWSWLTGLLWQHGFGWHQLWWWLVIVLVAWLMSLLPGWLASRRALQDGLNPQ